MTFNSDDLLSTTMTQYRVLGQAGLLRITELSFVKQHMASVAVKQGVTCWKQYLY